MRVYARHMGHARGVRHGQEAFHIARGNARDPRHDRHGAGEIGAVPFLAFQQKIGHKVPVRRRDARWGQGVGIVLVKIIPQGDELVQIRGLVLRERAHQDVNLRIDALRKRRIGGQHGGVQVRDRVRARLRQRIRESRRI